MERKRLIVCGGAAILLARAAGMAQVDPFDVARARDADLRAEARGRTSLLAGAGEGGHDADGFHLADGDYRLNLGGVVQFRYSMNVRDGGGAEADDDVANGFESRRTTLILSGTLPQGWVYLVQGDFAADGGTFTLEQAAGINQISDRWQVGFGQLYAPLIWEDYVADWKLQGMEFSPTSSTFTPGLVQGVWAQYQADTVRGWVWLVDGAATPSTTFTSSAEADIGFGGRLEGKLAGEWSRFADFTSFRGSGRAAKLGGMAHYQSGGDTVGTADMSVFLGTVDFCWESDGWNLFVAGIYRFIDPAAGSTLDDLGFQVQGGLFVTDASELFARYDVVLPDDDDRATAADEFSTIAVGLNHYFLEKSHAAKFTVDVSWFLDEQSGSIVPADTNLGLLPSDEDGQLAIRAQFQLLF